VRGIGNGTEPQETSRPPYTEAFRALATVIQYGLAVVRLTEGPFGDHRD
jgi:hypothetical protein